MVDPLGRPPLMMAPVLSPRMPWFPSTREPWQDHGCLLPPHQASRGEGVPVWLGPAGDGVSLLPLSVPIDGSNPKSEQLLGDSFGEAGVSPSRLTSGATGAIESPLWRRESERGGKADPPPAGKSPQGHWGGTSEVGSIVAGFIRNNQLSILARTTFALNLGARN